MFNTCANATKQGYSNYKVLIQILSTFWEVDLLFLKKQLWWGTMEAYGRVCMNWYAFAPPRSELLPAE